MATRGQLPRSQLVGRYNLISPFFGFSGKLSFSNVININTVIIIIVDTMIAIMLSATLIVI